MEHLIKEHDTGLTIEVVVHAQMGLHARPAARLVQEMQAFSSDIYIEHDATRADAKSILDILSLAATSGSKLTITAVGHDAKPALMRAAELFTSGFKE